jgi:hypothetical protein
MCVNAICMLRSRGSSVSIVTELRTGRLWFYPRYGQGYFTLRYHVQTGSAANPAHHMITRALSPGVDRSGYEAEHSLPSSAEVKNAWSFTSISSYVLMAWCLIKHGRITDFFHDNMQFMCVDCIGFCYRMIGSNVDGAVIGKLHVMLWSVTGTVINSPAPCSC